MQIGPESIDSNDPFPLTFSGRENYRAAQHHSAQVDAWLGFRIKETEAEIQREARGLLFAGAQAWVGLAEAALQTPYSEFREIVERLRPAAGDRLVDLGAGYGRLGFVLARHFPESEFLGFELVPRRVAEGSSALARFGARRARLEVLDLEKSPESIPSAFAHFLYDFGSRRAIARVLERLRELARTEKVTVVGRGRAARDAIEREHPWLSQVVTPEHFDHYTIYRSGS